MKLFCVSDIHSYWTPFKKALDEKGFEPNNKDHLLIVLGDVFDRGDESYEVFNFLNNLTNVVLVRGNHEDLLEEMLNRGYGERHDISNGTVNTVVSLADYTGKKTSSTKECCDAVKEMLTPFFNKFVNYFETRKFVFTHGFIPCEKFTGLDKPWYQQGRKLEYNVDWRSSSDVEWEAARWLNGIKASFARGIFEPAKQIVVGHWHCSYGHYLKAFKKALADGTDIEVEEFGPTAIWEPFETEHLIAIDKCTAHTGEVNVIVLEDELLGTEEKL